MENQSDQRTAGSITGLSSEKDFSDHYEVLMAIGQGGYGQVSLALHRLTGTPVAVKVLQKRRQSLQNIRSQIEVMGMVNHPNIISLIQVIETHQKMYMVMELAKGESLLQNIDKFGHLVEEDARKIFRQLLSAMSYCHEQGIAHQDIKPDNVIIDYEGRVKLIDFGMSALFKPGQMVDCILRLHEVSAPEIFFQKTCDPSKVDAWSLGVTLYFMVTGTFPFQATNPWDLMQKILNTDYDIPRFLSEELQNLISLLLTANPTHRPTVKEIMGHPWLHQGSTESLCEDNTARGPDRNITEAMASIHAEDVEDSLINKKYNETVALSKIFEIQASQRENITIRTNTVNAGITPCPSLSDPAVPLTLKGNVSRSDFLKSSSKNPLQKHNQQTGNQDISRLSTPATPLSCMERMLPLDTVPQNSETCPYTSTTTHGSKQDPEKAMASQNAAKEDCHIYPEPLSVPYEASSGSPRCREAWHKRVLNSFLQLCCCVPCKKVLRKIPRKKRTHRGQNRIAPIHWEEGSN